MLFITSTRLAPILAVVPLLLAACAGTSGRGSPAGTGRQEITVTAQDIAFPQKQLTLRAGAPARLVFVNQGAIEHDVTIPGLAPETAVAAESHAGAGHSMGALVPGTVHAAAQKGDRASVEFTPKAGMYEFYCSVPGHREAGMVGTLRVE